MSLSRVYAQVVELRSALKALNDVLLSIAKLQNLKAIHNLPVLLLLPKCVVINRKTTKFESNLQLDLLRCRTRKVSTTEQKKVQKERIIKYKDSTTLFQKNEQTLQLDTHTSQEYEVTVESDKDSIGNSKELTYTRIRDGNNETIRVRGGKVKITTKRALSNSQIVANTTLTSTISTTNNELRNTESTTAFSHKTKDVKGIVNWWVSLLLVLLAGVIGWRMWKCFHK